VVKYAQRQSEVPAWLRRNLDEKMKDESQSTMTAIQIWQGSDGEATKEFYRQLQTYGLIGEIAVALFRASKASVLWLMIENSGASENCVRF
jgi:hypothetical protein